ncbi:Ionotropic receptor 75a, partial [Diabrotica virgifera virgifera]
METKKPLFFLILLLKFSIQNENSEIIKLIADFVGKLNVPTKVFVHVCWSK